MDQVSTPANGPIGHREIQFSSIGFDREESIIAKIGHFDEVAIVKHESSNRWAMILPDLSGGGRWRVQHFDLGGFTSHDVAGSKSEAIRLVAKSIRFPVRDDHALDRIQDTPDFQLGLYRAEQMSLVQRGQISYSEFKQRVRTWCAPIALHAKH